MTISQLRDGSLCGRCCLFRLCRSDRTPGGDVCGSSRYTGGTGPCCTLKAFQGGVLHHTQHTHPHSNLPSLFSTPTVSQIPPMGAYLRAYTQSELLPWTPMDTYHAQERSICQCTQGSLSLLSCSIHVPNLHPHPAISRIYSSHSSHPDQTKTFI